MKALKSGTKSPDDNKVFPGALGVQTYYKNCREQGIKMTVEEAESTRSVWIQTFKEMQKHMRPQLAKNVKVAFNAYGMERISSEEDDEDEDNGKRNYMAELPCGQIRNRCSYNAACNTQFQGTVAIGAKLAGWALVYNGYGDRLLNFVHDEYLYWLWPDELQTHIPRIEQLMISAMKIVIPDIKVGVESSCCNFWDKKAVEFSKLTYDDSGLPIIEDPPYVKQLLTEQERA
jgi:DNA polymerase I-like protein with 3'-5' exonuclease and polymerase domains